MMDYTADDDLPQHITKMSSLIGADVYHCKICSGEGRMPGTIDHHDDCRDAVEGGDACVDAMLSAVGTGSPTSASESNQANEEVADPPRMHSNACQLRNRADNQDDDASSVETVLKIDGVTGPVFARSLEHDEYDYEAVYTSASLTEYEQASAIETLLADRGGEVVPIDESPFAGDGPDTAVTGRDYGE